ncbi:DUF4276 family protein [Nostoc sp. CHAB 5844]|nr:DUF4276 family protein [Nostoc sp. CHAB 5844]
MNEEKMIHEQCLFFEFGLFVTGKTEEEYLPSLFINFLQTGICNFKVLRRIGQRSPITSNKRQLKMVGSGKVIPDRDEQEIGLPARKYLSEKSCRYLLLIDDLEQDRSGQVQQVFQRYRNALDTILTEEQRTSAAVHFLVNMLEAYYFADAQAINDVLGTSVENYEGDVETILHPKNQLKALYPEFDEKADGGQILNCLRVEYILSRPNTCASLRTLFYWCYKILKKYPYTEVLQQFQAEKYRFNDGILSEITKYQLEDTE